MLFACMVHGVMLKSIKKEYKKGLKSCCLQFFQFLKVKLTARSKMCRISAARYVTTLVYIINTAHVGIDTHIIIAGDFIFSADTVHVSVCCMKSILRNTVIDKLPGKD